jgi:hypothetical protein
LLGRSGTWIELSISSNDGLGVLPLLVENISSIMGMCKPNSCSKTRKGKKTMVNPRDTPALYDCKGERPLRRTEDADDETDDDEDDDNLGKSSSGNSRQKPHPKQQQ